MKRTIARAAGMVAAILLVGRLAAFEWPVTGVNPIRLFGQRADGALERGILFEDAGSLRAAGHGELVMVIERNRNMRGFPSALGNAAIVAHDDGLVTVYGGLESINAIEGRTLVDSGALIGVAGSSAWGKSGAASFSVIDTAKRRLINPLLVLPNLADNRAPTVSGVTLVSQGNQVFPLAGARFVRQGRYRLYAEVSDELAGRRGALAPFRVAVSVNGMETLAIPFETMEERDGRLFLAGERTDYQGLYEKDGRVFLGELSLARGKVDLLISARDVAGNERNALFPLQVE